MADTNFLGFNNFIWFNGVVEDRQDPFKVGRVRVRCIGIHTHDKEVLPTADLPWAQCVLPVTSPGISGLGQSPSFLVEGSWVFGYFRDGESCQEPVVIGSVPGRPVEGANPQFGFYDPGGNFPRDIMYPDTNRLAANEKVVVAGLPQDANPHPHLILRKFGLTKEIATADFNATTNAEDKDIPGSDGDTWDQPEVPYAAVYPMNHVYESESGHIQEFDDTEDAERIYQSHRTGTSYEIDPFGTIVYLNKVNKYEITSFNNYNYIGGDSDITIDGRHKIYLNKLGLANNNYDIQIGPNANINIQVDKGNINLVTVDGNINVNSGGDYNLKVKGNYISKIEGSKRETIEGSKTSDTTMGVIHRGQNVIIEGSTVHVIGHPIDLN